MLTHTLAGPAEVEAFPCTIVCLCAATCKAWSNTYFLEEIGYLQLIYGVIAESNQGAQRLLRKAMPALAPLVANRKQPLCNNTVDKLD